MPFSFDFLNPFKFTDQSKKSGFAQAQSSIFRVGGQSSITANRTTSNQIDNSTSTQSFFIIGSPSSSINAPSSKKFGSTQDLATPTSFSNPLQVSPSVFGSSQGAGTGTNLTTVLIAAGLIGGAIIIVPSILKGGRK